MTEIGTRTAGRRSRPRFPLPHVVRSLNVAKDLLRARSSSTTALRECRQKFASKPGFLTLT
jgi:hypothetical protein